MTNAFVLYMCWSVKDDQARPGHVTGHSLAYEEINLKVPMQQKETDRVIGPWPTHHINLLLYHEVITNTFT